MIEVIKVDSKNSGNLKAHDILKNIVDQQTLLALSGGTSPDYQKMIVDSQGILPGAICVVDERYSEPFHKNSNELLLRNAGVISYCEKKGIDFYKILESRGIEQTAEDYDQLMSEIFVKYSKKVGVMGIGSNSHTAGIFPDSEAIRSANFVISETVDDKQSFRSSPAALDAGLKFSQRITLTLRALGEFQYFIILVFGEEKRETLRIMLDENENDMQKYPAIFYRKSQAKNYLITDIDL